MTIDQFRQRVRSYVGEHAPELPARVGTRSPESDAEAEVLRAWSAAVYEQGFYGAEWPEQYGGAPDYDPNEEFVVTEEFARARAAVPIGAGGLAGFALLHFGSKVQQDEYLPKIRTYEHVWCQLFSEPDAGSDLASMRATALRDGDGFVLNGQKVWSTNAFYADMGFLLARTDPSVSKHAGISAFALDMTLPGITTRPLREMTGTADFNEVFFDDVRIPESALLGAENDGWRVATESLAAERAGVGALVVRLRQNLDALVALARTVPSTSVPSTGPSPATATGGRAAPGMQADDPIVRQRLAGFTARVEIAALLSQATMRRRMVGEFRAMDVPLSKLTFAELNWELSNYGVELQGMRGVLATDAPDAADAGHWQDELLYAKAYTISGGSNEIMRNLLAERALGLPR